MSILIRISTKSEECIVYLNNSKTSSKYTGELRISPFKSQYSISQLDGGRIQDGKYSEEFLRGWLSSYGSIDDKIVNKESSELASIINKISCEEDLSYATEQLVNFSRKPVVLWTRGRIDLFSVMIAVFSCLIIGRLAWLKLKVLL